MSRLGRLTWIFLSLLLLAILPACGQEPQKSEKKEPWTGKLADGRVITQSDMKQFLQAHSLWLTKCINEPTNISQILCHPYPYNLSNSSLVGADLSYADLRGTNLNFANLTGANLFNARLSGAKLAGGHRLWGASLTKTNLSDANLEGADLSGANLILANLSGANLDATNLSGANLGGVNLNGAIFEPKPGTLPDISFLLRIQGLFGLTYKLYPYGLVELREVYKKAGMRDQERELTYALNHTRRLKLWEQGSPMGRVESILHLVLFELTCDYGMTPGRPLKIIGLGLLVFALPYMLALKSRKRKTGLWVLLLPDRVLDRSCKDWSYRLTTRTPFRSMASPWRVIRILRLGFYFSLLSAFNLGWREFNVGNWITRLQKREYTLRATGWVRTVAGLQSLLGVYMLALWVLSYFGRPFE